MRRFLLVSLVLIAVPLTARQAPQRMVFGVDFSSGRVLWQREAHRGAPPHPRHLKNSYASETPTTDGERVYVLFEMTMATPAIAQGNLIVRTAERLYRIGGKEQGARVLGESMPLPRSTLPPQPRGRRPRQRFHAQRTGSRICTGSGAANQATSCWHARWESSKRANDDEAPYPDSRAKRRCDSGKSTPMANQ